MERSSKERGKLGVGVERDFNEEGKERKKQRGRERKKETERKKQGGKEKETEYKAVG